MMRRARRMVRGARFSTVVGGGVVRGDESPARSDRRALPTAKVVHTDELQAPSTATTVKFVDGKPVVTDGPFIEAKETIGGYAVVDVADLDTALDMAKAWPPGGMVEVRPIVPREGEQ